MNNFCFATLRLGKTSVEDIKKIDSSPIGIQEIPFQATVICTQVPTELETGCYVFLWLGSDNSKGIPTTWKQGFKAFGKIVNLVKGQNFNDESTIGVDILYIFPNAINRLDILREAPQAYYWCSSMPIIGLDDHSNQTVRMMASGSERSDIKAFFHVIHSSCNHFREDIIKINKDFEVFFDYRIPNPKSVTNSQPAPTSQQKDSTILPYLAAILTKPFILLAGISGTGKSQIVRKLAQATDNIDTFKEDADRWALHKPTNFELIQVKPNWHNSYDLVGYKSNINNEHYEFTPFVEFVAKAWQNLNTPFFLCLDEMNLAPVEEYFAEYLSAIESRSFDKSAACDDLIYQTDPIIKPFDNFGEKVAKEMLDHLFGTRIDANLERHIRITGLTLPPNLIVMGTVNMDETTFSFSRKVLDRAMSIEMNDVDFTSCIRSEERSELPVLTAINQALINRPISSLEVIEGSGKESKSLNYLLSETEAKAISDYLSVLNNEILEGTPFKLGYRACNEALLYARACKELGRKNYLSVAIDEFTTMKILSRIEGDEQKLKTKQGEPLLEKIEWKIRSMVQNLDNSISLEKIDSMKRILERDKFVSFWG